ncbi:hypothetical protein [uncultured Methanobrevibacter sp.]|uniref:hypothetical protein n=1 Tax=uncultured Methanobrevibacter sp. TaxID=253161 RepID=UPI002582B386|nr:hypothetical protein [uncultured Methanobrevibacter sp.]
MNIKKILVATIVLAMIVLSMSAVNAGFLDFLSGVPELSEQDFENFTMKVPVDSTFKESSSMNRYDGDDNEDTMNFMFNDDPDGSHPSWSDGNISIQYFDYKEDGFSDYKEVLSAQIDSIREICVPENEKQEGDLYIFTAHPDDRDLYVVCKESNNKLIVLTDTNMNLNLLKEMGNSIKFK